MSLAAPARRDDVTRTIGSPLAQRSRRTVERYERESVNGGVQKPRRDEAGIAASKLKTRLQVAFNKLQGYRQRDTINDIDPFKSFTQVKNVNTRPLALKDHNLQNQGSPKSGKQRTNYEKKELPLLSAYGEKSDKSASKAAQHLQLLSIKKTSKHYSHNANIPLFPGTGPQKGIKVVNPGLKSAWRENPAVSSELVVAKVSSASFNLPKPVAQIQIQNGNAGSHRTLSLGSMSLPSIDKVLNTPIKNLSSSEDKTSLQRARSVPLKNEREDRGNHPDDTIDADDTMTRENSTILENEKTSNQNCSSTILGSSPLRASPSNNFATPKSFSVAKSLLQLGSGFYN